MIESRTEPGEELVLTPLGFRSARVLETPTNVVVERDGRTLTARLVSDRDGTTLHFTVLGFGAPSEMHRDGLPLQEQARVHDDHGREVAPDPRWQTGGWIRRRTDGAAMLDWQLKLLRLDPDVRSVELSFGGPAGEWNVTIPVAETRGVGIPARRTDAADEHHGITVSAPAVARTADVLAIELEAEIAPDPGDVPFGLKRYVQGIGAHSLGRVADERLVLRDDRGGEHLQDVGVPEPAAVRRARQVVRFLTVPSDARSAVLEIPYVAVSERTDEIATLPVPSVTDLEYAGCAVHLDVSRLDAPDGKKVRTEISPRDTEATRQLLHFQRVEVVGGSPIGMTTVHCAGRPTLIDVRDPASSPTVTFGAPVLKLRGPWRIEIPLPPLAAVPRTG